MILTITLNPMVDKTVQVDHVRIGGVTRAMSLQMAVGGKGVNMARQLRKFGRHVCAALPAGGETGALIASLLTAEGIPHAITRIHDRTREGVTYRAADGTVTAVFEPPHSLAPEEVSRFERDVKTLLDGDVSWLLCGGSAPCKAMEGTYASLISYAKSRGIATALDAYGAVLEQAIGSRPTVLHLNQQEAREVSGPGLGDGNSVIAVLQSLLQRGVEFVILTDGAAPLFAGTSNGVWRVEAPRVKSVNPTGSGDSLVAGIVHGLIDTWDVERCLRIGAAAGAANASMWEVAMASSEAVASLENAVSIQRIA